MMTFDKLRTAVVAIVALPLAVASCSEDGSESDRSGATTVPPSTTSVSTTTVSTTVPTPTATAPTTSAAIIARPPPGPGELEIVDGNMVLAAGKYIDSFGVRNTGGKPMAWTAVGVPASVILDATSGTLDPDGFVPVLVTVKPELLPAGPFELEFHISANDTAMPVTVKGTKP